MMRLIQFAFASLVFFVASSDKAQAEFIYASTTTSVEFLNSNPSEGLVGDFLSEDRVLRALYSVSSRIDGFMRFDLSGITNTEPITSLSLTLYSVTDTGTPEGAPALMVYRSDDDDWTTTSTFDLSYLANPLLDEDVTAGFPATGSTQPFVFTLDATEVEWQNQLTDGKLTLVLRTNNSTTGNSTYWRGSDAGDFRPRLTFGYGDVAAVPEPSSLALFGISSLVARCVFVRRRRIQKTQAEPV